MCPFFNIGKKLSITIADNSKSVMNSLTWNAVFYFCCFIYNIFLHMILYVASLFLTYKAKISGYTYVFIIPWIVYQYNNWLNWLGTVLNVPSEKLMVPTFCKVLVFGLSLYVMCLQSIMEYFVSLYSIIDE